MSANFTPTFVGYTEQEPLLFWCQKVLPLVYDDSLSYYEVVAKLSDYINGLLSDMQELIERVEALENNQNEVVVP